VYKALGEAIADAEARGISLSALALEREALDQGRKVEDIRAALARALEVMRGAIGDGLTGDLRSSSGLVGGDAAKLNNNAAGPLKDAAVLDCGAEHGGHRNSRDERRATGPWRTGQHLVETQAVHHVEQAANPIHLHEIHKGL